MCYFQDRRSQYLIADGDILKIDERGAEVEENRGFINVACFSYEKTISDDRIANYRDNQLKLHVCLPEKNLDHRIKGWNIITDILIAFGIPEFKIISPSMNPISEWDISQRGKDITIYPFLPASNLYRYHGLNDLNELKELVTGITQTLVKYRVQPGYRPVLQGDTEGTGREDYPIPGTNYVTLRASSYVDLTNEEMLEISQFLRVSPEIEGEFYPNTAHYDVVPDVRVVTVW